LCVFLSAAVSVFVDLSATAVPVFVDLSAAAVPVFVDLSAAAVPVFVVLLAAIPLFVRLSAAVPLFVRLSAPDMVVAFELLGPSIASGLIAHLIPQGQTTFLLPIVPVVPF